MERTNPSELLIRQRLAALSRALPGARKGEVASVHQARVATRRLREALPLISTGRRREKLQRAVRRMTRALGPVRELDVTLQTLAQLQKRGEVPDSAVARLRASLARERDALLAQMLRGLDRADLDTLRRRATAAARAQEPPPARGRIRDPERLRAAVRRAARRAAALRDAIDAAAAIYLPDRLHDVRIAVKKLRYALELVNELRASQARTRIATLKRAQDLLGRMHDLEVLIARTRAEQSVAAPAPTLKVSADLDVLVRVLETECRQLHATYMTLRPSLLSLCDAVVAADAKAA